MSECCVFGEVLWAGSCIVTGGAAQGTHNPCTQTTITCPSVLKRSCESEGKTRCLHILALLIYSFVGNTLSFIQLSEAGSHETCSLTLTCCHCVCNSLLPRFDLHCYPIPLCCSSRLLGIKFLNTNPLTK